MEILSQYFPDLDALQRERFARLQSLYEEWNAKINVVSRQDMENLYERHILHSLAIAKFIRFKPGSEVLDLGTGGGFPGIPLAIFFPEVNFTLVDSIGKKIRVTEAVAEALELKNVRAIHGRAEELKSKNRFDFVITRAVATLDKLMPWSAPLISKKHRNAYPNGLIALKGGRLEGEIKALPGKPAEYTELVPISQYFKEDFFIEKYVVYVQA